MNDPGYLIGVDAGGTKTAAAAYESLTGKLLTCVYGEHGSFSVDGDAALQNVINVIEECIKNCGKACSFICVGAAGLGDIVRRRLVSDKLKERFCCPVQVVDDGELALYAALKGEDGLLVISGTGSIAYGKKGELVRRFGGWGHLLDDRGSGYDIAISMFRQMVYDYDHMKEPSALSVAVMQFLGLGTVQEVIRFLYSVQKGKIASVVPVVVKLAEEKDPQAAELLDSAGKKLAELAAGLCAELGFDSVRIAPMGSILLKCERVYQSFTDEVRRTLPEAELIVSTNDPTKGSYYLYKTLNKMKR